MAWYSSSYSWRLTESFLLPFESTGCKLPKWCVTRYFTNVCSWLPTAIMFRTLQSCKYSLENVCRLLEIYSWTSFWLFVKTLGSAENLTKYYGSWSGCFCRIMIIGYCHRRHRPKAYPFGSACGMSWAAMRWLYSIDSAVRSCWGSWSRRALVAMII